MKQFTDAEFAALTTEQREELRKEFCVYNDGSQRFKDTVIRFLGKELQFIFNGLCLGYYYHYPKHITDVIFITANHPVLTINQFCELFPEYSDVKKPQLSNEDIEVIAKSVVTMIASGNTIKGSDGVEYQVTVVEQPKNEYEHLIGKWVRRIYEGTLSFTVNKWYQIIGNVNEMSAFIDNYGNKNGRVTRNKELFDLNNPLDYNPETLVGKYLRGYKINSVKPHAAYGWPILTTDEANGHYWIKCSDIDPSDVTDAPPTPEPSYKIEDIVEIVKPAYYLSDDGVYKDESAYKSLDQFPKESQGKQVAALCQLFTLMQWANGGRDRKAGEYVYQPYMSPGEICLMQTMSSYSPIYFFDAEKGRKLIEANEQLFKDFLGV